MRHERRPAALEEELDDGPIDEHPHLDVAIDGADAPQAAIVDVIARILESFGCAGDDAIHGARIVRSAVHGFVTLEASEAFINPLATDDSFAALLDFVVAGFAAGGSGESAA